MKQKYIFFFLLTASVVGMLSCEMYTSSDKVEQRLIFPIYSVKYNADDGSLSATASFKENNESGKTLKLSRKSSLSFNEVSMKREKIEKKIVYTYNQQHLTEMPINLGFKYVNDKGDSFCNNLKMNSIRVDKDYIFNKSEPNHIVFAGNNIGEEEDISLMMQKDSAIFVIVPATMAGNEIFFSPELWKDVPEGTYKAYLNRSFYTTNVNAMDRGGVIDGKYQSKKFEIIIRN